MFPFYFSQISINPLEDGDQDQTQLPPFTLATDTSYPFPILFNTTQDRVSDIDHRPQQQILEPKPVDLLLIGGPSDRTIPSPSNNSYNTTTIEQSSCCPYVTNEDPQASGKWMSSKMRIMRKMMNSDQIVMNKPRENFQVVHDQQQPNQDIIRVCSDCNTTKTPLWRSGPRGPKSLCNACGIRQRKARRAMAAASGGVVTKQTPREESEVDRTVPFKKRCRFTNSGTAQKKLRFDEVTMNSGKNSAFHRVFPQDERDAAILLMALSCGLIRS